MRSDTFSEGLILSRQSGALDIRGHSTPNCPLPLLQDMTRKRHSFSIDTIELQSPSGLLRQVLLTDDLKSSRPSKVALAV